MSNFGELVDYKHANYVPRNNSKTALAGSASELLSKQDLLSVMAKYFQTKVFVVERYSFYELSTPNPFSKRDECLKMEVTVTNSKGTKEDHHFFVKRLTSESGNCHEKDKRACGFLKETELYSTVFADFEKTEKDGINRWGPKYYLSKPGKLLVLEDLTSKGYYQVGRRECLDKEHILAVMRALAAFHSASIKLEERVNAGSLAPRSDIANAGQLVTVADMYSHLNFELDSKALKSPSANPFLEAGIKSQVNLIDQLPGYSREEMQEIQSHLPGLLRKLPELMKPSTKYRNVFVHGDLGPNNLFFRRNGTNLEAILVDYQTVHYAPPAYDLIMLLHLNQRMVFRMKERQSLIQTYYNMFSEELAKKGICIQAVLSVKDYLDSCEECTEWVTLTTVMYLQMHLLSDEVIAKYLLDPNLYNKTMLKERSEMIAECFSKDEVYRTRMTEAMNDLIKKCITIA